MIFLTFHKSNDIFKNFTIYLKINFTLRKVGNTYFFLNISGKIFTFHFHKNTICKNIQEAAEKYTFWSSTRNFCTKSEIYHFDFNRIVSVSRIWQIEFSDLRDSILYFKWRIHLHFKIFTVLPMHYLDNSSHCVIFLYNFYGRFFVFYWNQETHIGKVLMR